MAENPDEYSFSESEQERLKIESNASELLIGMEPFTEGGEFENLSQKTEVDITGSKVVYLDLQQQETRGGTGLMMQLLFNAVYERAKQATDKKVIFAIDEARYIMKDASNLAFLEQAVRHSRHYDLSIQFITQTIDEFFAQDESEAIADNCSLKLLHRVEGMDEELADELDLTGQQMDYVRTAMAGDEEAGYSEGLLGVADEGWYPIHVRANDLERQIIDFEVGEDTREDISGTGTGRTGRGAGRLRTRGNKPLRRPQRTLRNRGVSSI
ncbi:MAG: type IV secretory system conjugative DNA transfer family protein [Halobacteria archaeon]|nr:type IV secretory system conjugative DNA transfer family protein [Halobacteria archaeon]